jgi:hypothetical protein
MKKIFSWFLGCLALATLTTCNNEKYLPIYTLEGKLYFDCKRTQVVANATISVIQIGSTRRPNERKLINSTTTDAEGNFRLEYKMEHDSFINTYEMTISSPTIGVSKSFKTPISLKKDWYVRDDSNVKFKIKLNQNNYSNQDTLYYVMADLEKGEGLFELRKKTGGFQEAEIIDSYSIRKRVFDTQKIVLVWAIGQQNMNNLLRNSSTAVNIPLPNGIYFDSNGCGDDKDIILNLP